MINRTKIYTDGACPNNGKYNATAGYCVIIGDKYYTGRLRPNIYRYSLFKGTSKLSGENKGQLGIIETPAPITNNRAEFLAIIIGLLYTSGPLEVVSDSKHCIQVATEWMEGWYLNGYFGTTRKKNLDLIEILHTLSRGRDIIYTWQVGHVPIPRTQNEKGNHWADKYAVESATAVDYKMVRGDFNLNLL